MHCKIHHTAVIAWVIIFFASGFTAYANIKLRPYFNKPVRPSDSLHLSLISTDTIPLIADSLFSITDSTVIPETTLHEPLPAAKYGSPSVFSEYTLLDSVTLADNQTERRMFPDAYSWLDNYNASNLLLKNAQQSFQVGNPRMTRFFSNDLPEVPKKYRNYINNLTTRITLDDIKVDDQSIQGVESNIERKIWLHTFDGSLQFSQAYISPNWYQGGNNNLNMIGQLIYNVKLNQKFHPNLLFDATISYKLALNSAPDDSIHSFNISEDILQINATFGLKAIKKWYYSANLMFKTQLLNNYPTNSRSIQAAFLSPGELNLGLGMTYNTTNKKKTASFGASISPISWNLKTCTNRNVDETAYGLFPGRKTKNKVGSSAECTFDWKITYNISYHSRLFLFTDYEYAYGDWEHSLDFNINRFLSTRLYVHMRYDTSTPTVADSNWHKFQLKEIFSFGFAYHFGTI